MERRCLVSNLLQDGFIPDLVLGWALVVVMAGWWWRFAGSRHVVKGLHIGSDQAGSGDFFHHVSNIADAM